MGEIGSDLWSSSLTPIWRGLHIHLLENDRHKTHFYIQSNIGFGFRNNLGAIKGTDNI